MLTIVFLQPGDQGVCARIREVVSRSSTWRGRSFVRHRSANFEKKVLAHIELLAASNSWPSSRYHLCTLLPGNAQLFVASNELTCERSRWDKKLYSDHMKCLITLFNVIFDLKMQEIYDSKAIYSLLNPKKSLSLLSGLFKIINLLKIDM